MSAETTGWVLDVLLAVGVVGVAALALGVRDRTAAVVLFVVFGLLIATAYARLGAPDIALAEAAIGAAVTGALLLGACGTSGPATGATGSVGGSSGASARWTGPGRGRQRALSLGVLVALGVAAAALARELLGPPAAPGLAGAVADTVPESGVEHPVTAVLLSFRAYDTMLEVVVLLVAAVVALSLLPDRDLERSAGFLPAPAPLPVMVRVVVPVGAVVAGWLLFVGAYGPGGAFQAGAVLGGVLVLLVLAGRRPGVLSGRLLRWGLALGAAVFLLAAFVTLLLVGGVLEYGGAAAALIVAIETAIALSVGVTLAALYLAEEPVAEDDADADSGSDNSDISDSDLATAAEPAGERT